MRLIDADELIYILKKKKSFGELTAKEAIRTVKEQPTIIKWIPVSERLPKEEGFYLVTQINCSNKLYVDTAKYRERHGATNWVSRDIIAWMPLPEPYKEKEVEND